MFSYEDAPKGILFSVFSKGTNKRTRLSEKDKPKRVPEKYLKNNQWGKWEKDIDSIKHAQKIVHFFVKKDRCFSEACKVTGFLQRIFYFWTGFIEACLFLCWGFTLAILCDSMRKNNQTKGLRIMIQNNFAATAYFYFYRVFRDSK
ncbi:hypothetical protein [Anaerotignum sp.]|uniref:hypothetical protein n=1 Tax=Anaerotignum sp. TaxID=2039241 RepID=UPI002A90E019|nr:hypothetical protein [Anaerotignum sp.]